MYPNIAIINGKEYKINTDFKIALKCMGINKDKDICDEERSLAIIYLLFGFIPENDLEKFLEKSKLFLQCGIDSKEQEDTPEDMDFIKDYKYIYSSFKSDYKMDINTENIHWWAFIDLIQGLTETSSLSRVRELRNFDINSIKDPIERAKILKAKKQVSLEEKKKYTEEEMQIINSIYGNGGDNND